MTNIDILIGSTLGNAEYVAEHIEEQLQSTHNITMHYKPNLTDLSTDHIWLIVTSTHGAGECPENIQPFLEQLKIQTKSFANLRYNIVVLGDKNYDTYCLAGNLFNDQLTRLGGRSFNKMVCINAQNDLLPEEQIEEWLKNWQDQLSQ
jgi:MioC protein